MCHCSWFQVDKIPQMQNKESVKYYRQLIILYHLLAMLHKPMTALQQNKQLLTTCFLVISIGSLEVWLSGKSQVSGGVPSRCYL